jgi:hypothetical protein
VPKRLGRKFGSYLRQISFHSSKKLWTEKDYLVFLEQSKSHEDTHYYWLDDCVGHGTWNGRPFHHIDPSSPVYRAQHHTHDSSSLHPRLLYHDAISQHSSSLLGSQQRTASTPNSQPAWPGRSKAIRFCRGLERIRRAYICVFLLAPPPRPQARRSHGMASLTVTVYI